jgi:hypothetical protein
VSAAAPTPASYAADALRATVEALAVIERLPCSPGEHEAARWLQQRLTEAGADARIEQEHAFDSFARPLAALCGLGAAAGLLAPRRPRLAAVLAALTTAAIADDISNGPRLFRRATMRRKPTWNVIAESGDPQGEHTIVLLAHHDAAPTGMIFDPALQRLFGDLAPGLLERIDTAIPIWWPVLAAPSLVGLGALRGDRTMARIGLLGCLTALAAFADIARSPVTPGANDNLTGVAVLIALAERLRREPIDGVRVLLVSCGSEESLQGGIREFAARHFPRLDRDRTSVLNIETVGSPELIMLEGEGPVIMEDYHARGFRDRVARAADRAGVHLRRGMRARSSTDSVIPSRAGYPTATLSSMDRYKSLTEYHQLSDTPDNVHYGTVADAAAVAEALVRGTAGRER